jgi:hypothetical protein
MRIRHALRRQAPDRQRSDREHVLADATARQAARANPGLRAVLAMRALAHSNGWLAAWTPYAATHRKEVRIAA